MKKILEKLYNKKKLTKKESYNLTLSIIKKKFNNIQITSIITALKVRGEKYHELYGIVKACLKKQKKFPTPKCVFGDIVGTGGDKNNINISTASAIVSASMGFKVIKHCNKSSSGLKTGSANILKKFNFKSTLNTLKSKKFFDKFNICFLYAPKYNPIFKNVKKIRKCLNTKTFLNIIGPLLNPSKPKFAVIGTYNKKIMYIIAKILKKLKFKRAFIINSNNTDKINLYYLNNIIELKNKKIKSYTLSSQDFGIKKHEKPMINNNILQNNFKIIKNVFLGRGPLIYKEIIAVNTAIFLKLFGLENLKKNTKKILHHINNKKVYHFINKIKF
ncbi:anthranilate phosphoribosyltransferase [Buchnera aphidicola]|uniref:anthranilate phosphoribosyltransferase n=1 Tax=Buchnera aphidicola TaxID=9 RepID=UPI0030EC2F02